MKSLLMKLSDDKTWEDYFLYKKNQQLLSKKEEENLERFINNREYLYISERMIKNEYIFSLPEKHLINKMNKTKKRVVYTYKENEMYILKLLNYLMIEKYDDVFSPNCYSFRKNRCVKDAIYKIIKTDKIDEMASYKIDVANYFNSIPVEKMLLKLKEVLKEDQELYILISMLLLNDKVVFNGEVITEDKGIMAGIPISSFLANLYLGDLDKFFLNKGVLYARYSDDIIIFTDKENIESMASLLNEKIYKEGLSINNSKMIMTMPHEKWTFLGFSYCDGIIDISDITKKKIKGKIKRASRKIRRWMIRKNADTERAMKVMNRKFNRKFFGKEDFSDHSLTWAKWFFPVINTSSGLKEIDSYMQQNLRYICTGRYRKKNYDISYETLKKCGYIPLVSTYYNKKY